MGVLPESIQQRMDAFAEKMAAFQTRLFLNTFYVLIMPFAHVYLRVTGNLHHETTGFFQEPEHHTNDIEQHRKQY